MRLPIIRPSVMKKSISQGRLDVIQSQLASALSPPSTIDAGDGLQFLSNYMGDLSQHALDPDFQGVGKPNGRSAGEHSRSSMELQDAALELLEHLAAKSPKFISSSLLIDAMISYSGSKSHERIQALVKTVLVSSPYQTQEILAALRIATQSCFGTHTSPIDTLRSLRRATRALALILQAGNPSLLEEFTGPNNSTGVLILAQIYDQLLPSIATALSKSPRPVAQTLVRGDAEWAKSWLEIKIFILDVLQAAFLFVTSKNSPSEDTRSLAAFASSLTRSRPPPSQHDKRTLLVDSPLLSDYERLFQLSETLRTRGWEDGGPTATFAVFAEYLQVDNAVVRLLISSDAELERTPVVRTKALPVQADARGKGKGKATHEEPDLAIEDGVKNILAIFPDQDPIFLNRCLHHSTYSGGGGVERLVEALLGGTVPIELNLMDEERDAEDHFRDNRGNEEVEDMIKGRKNVFDALQMDMSSLRIGKKRDTADQMLDDSTWRREMKAEILRRAQEVSDDEEEKKYYPTTGETGRRKLIPFEEDEFDDEFGNVSVVGDGETSDGEDEEVGEKVPVEIRLELAYLESPALFDRDAATRRSAGRNALRVETGCSDEQIEGWKIMLERNPRKDQILGKHDFRGNKAVFSADVEPAARIDGERGGRGAQGRGRGGRSGSGSGGGGRGGEERAVGRVDGGGSRGRGGRGGGGHTEGTNTERDRALKEKNKSRERKRGHNRKMARGGGGVPA